jgi:hypothetical protein
LNRLKLTRLNATHKLVTDSAKTDNF